MKVEYLILLVEEFCRDNGFDISKIYEKMAEIYQDTYGVNIVKQMEENEKWDIAYYLEEIGIVDRYVTILNGLKKCVNEGWEI